MLDQKMSAKPVSSKRIEVVRRFVQAVEAKDISTVNQLITDNIVLEQPYSPLQPGGLRVEGRQAVNAFFNRIFSQYSQIRFVNIVFRQSRFDNAVILEGQGDFLVSSNPTPYRNQYIGVIEVVDSQIVLIREYFNPLIQPEASNPGSSQPNRQ
ncbi:nuclear transport factor 2 family protein [Phormidesmis sp. 146-35]